MSFSGRLRIARKEKGYSQEALAEELEVSRQSITKWETGTAFPELKKLLQLSVTLDKDLDWLMCDERNELMSNKTPAGAQLSVHHRIYDKDSLEAAVWDRRICGILKNLDGYEFTETVEEDDFSGDRTCVVFDSRMFAAGKGIHPETGEKEEYFTELKPAEAITALLRHVQQVRLSKQ